MKLDNLMKIEIPAPPRASWQTASLPESTAFKSGASRENTAPIAQPLDAAFLCRLYRSTALLSTVFAILMYFVAQSRGENGGQWSASFLAGSLVGAALLKSQEWMVRRVFAYAPERSAWKRLGPLLLLPGKYLLIGWALGAAIRAGWVAPIGFGLGFVTVQIVIAAKVAGRILSERVRSVREVYGTQAVVR